MNLGVGCFPVGEHSVTAGTQLQLLTIQQVAERLTLPVSEVEHLVDTGQLPDIHIRGRRLFDERDLNKLVATYKRVQSRSGIDEQA